MSGEINVISRTQHIIVDSASSSISLINEGPPGPSGPIGEVSTAAMNQAIDTALSTRGVPPGGLTGQVLVKLSDADYDVGWVTLP
jgi:hypothetical protein